MKVGDLVVYTEEYLGAAPQTIYVVGEIDSLLPLCRIWARYDKTGNFYYQNSPTNVRNYKMIDCRNIRLLRKSDDFLPEVIAKAKSIL